MFIVVVMFCPAAFGTMTCLHGDSFFHTASYVQAELLGYSSDYEVHRTKRTNTDTQQHTKG